MRSVTRIVLLFMTMLLVVSPSVSGQATPEAAVDVPGAVTDEAPDAGEPEDTGDALPPAGDDQDAAGTPAADQSMQTRQAPTGPGLSIQAVGDGTIIVDIAGSDPDQPVPTGALVCVSVIWSCVPWAGTPLTFTVPEGTYTVSFDQMDESYYTDTNATVTVGADETVELTLTLEPRQPSTLRLYVSTDTGVAIPAGTEACVSQDATAFTDAIDECQDMTGQMFADFTVNEGWVDVAIVTPVDSGFAGAGESVWVPGGTTYRDYFVLVDDADATVTIDVATEDGLLLGAAPAICLQHATEQLENCTWFGDPEWDNDGGGNYTFSVPAGTWTWVVEPSFIDTGYLPASGTVTVADGDELVIEALLPLRTENDVAVVSVDLKTFDGGDVPAGTQVCVIDALAETCETWAGGVVDVTAAAGPVTVYVIVPDDSGYTGFSQFLPMLATGETREISVVLYPLDTPLTLEKTVSDSAPESGDTVTYRIHAFGPAYEFLIEDVLPVELSEVSITCEGSFSSELPTTCYEVYDGIVVVPGIAGNETFMDVTVEITGVVTGEPGTTVSNIACVTTFIWTGDEVTCDTVDLEIAETITPEPTETPVVTPEPTETPDATETPVVTPEPSETPIVTPEPTETPIVTPEPSATPVVPAPTHPAKPGTPGEQPVVTTLPSTGSDGAASSPVLALAMALAAVAMLAGAGALRLRGTARR